MSDVYKTPDANLVTPSKAGDYGTVERGIAGDYEFSIRDVISEAFQKTKGAKWPLLLSIIIYSLIALTLFILSSVILFGYSALLMGLDLVSESAYFTPSYWLYQIVSNLILLPIIAGLSILALRRAINNDLPLNIKSLFNYYPKTFALFGATILMYLLMTIGFMLVIIPGIYLLVAYSFTFTLIADKNLSIWQAMESSRKAVSKRWFTMFGFLLVLSLIIIVSAIPLGIGLAWTLPMAMIAFAIVYRNMFGFHQSTII